MSRATEKLSSGRWLVLILCVSTYCLCILGTLALCITKAIGADTFLALFAGLTGIVTMITNSYYGRQDRKESKDEKSDKLV